ncbi:hypothetical protein [Alicyclobacillus sp. SP_1]|uniref:hypothetical protein n=1 Tax=Alicyclobacillus sp. SP_1 TaxID=2942475 RepID=UPI0021571588|nr:hypothetical protein [Alicyclobacillus sp. SP_1]
MEFRPADDVSLVHIKKVQELIGRHYQAMTRLRQSMFRMLIGTHVPHLEHYLTFLDDAQADISQYLQNELFATLMRYDSDLHQEMWDVIPEDMKLEIGEHGFVIKNIPKWMLGHGAKKKYSSLFRSDSPSIRKEIVWHHVLGKLLEKCVQQDSCEFHSFDELPNPKTYAKLVIVFRSDTPERIRDMDHYVPTFEPLVNRLRGFFISSDAPERLSFAFEWEQDSCASSATVDIYGYTSEIPFTSWRTLYEEVDEDKARNAALKAVKMLPEGSPRSSLSPLSDTSRRVDEEAYVVRTPLKRRSKMTDEEDGKFF